MKRFAIVLAGMVLFGALGMQGCGGGTAMPDNVAEDSGIGPQNAERNTAPSELAQKSFLLKSFDGKAYDGSVDATMMFNKDMRIAGNFCNRFVGQAEHVDGVLMVEQLATTRMMCADNTLNRLEMLIPQMLMNGAEASFDGRILTLRQGGHEAEYVLSR